MCFRNGLLDFDDQDTTDGDADDVVALHKGGRFSSSEGGSRKSSTKILSLLSIRCDAVPLSCSKGSEPAHEV
jgi:hypothetical protein